MRGAEEKNCTWSDVSNNKFALRLALSRGRPSESCVLDTTHVVVTLCFPQRAFQSDLSMVNDNVLYDPV